MFCPPPFVTEEYNKRHFFLSRLGRSIEYRFLGFANLSSVRVFGTMGSTIA